MTSQQIGVVLAVLGFIAWVVSWVALVIYGLILARNDRPGAALSLFSGAAILAAGVYTLTAYPPTP